VDVSPQNLASNGSFETNTDGWAALNGASLQRVPGGHDGSFALLVTSPGLSPGAYGVSDDPDAVQHSLRAGARYHYRAWVRAEAGVAAVTLRVRESTNNRIGAWVESQAVALSPSWAALDLDVTTSFTGSDLDMQLVSLAGAAFRVELTAFRVDDVSIVPLGGAAVASEAMVDPESDPDTKPTTGVHPNPVRADGARLLFATKRPGALTISIFDLSGREVRRLMSDEPAQAGEHVVAFDGRASGGDRLRDGVYYYQIRSPDGLQQGRLVILD